MKQQIIHPSYKKRHCSDIQTEDTRENKMDYNWRQTHFMFISITSQKKKKSLIRRIEYKAYHFISIHKYI